MPNPIDDNNDLANALGRLAGRWGLVEFSVEMIFTLLSEMPERKATITFSFFKATGTQKDIIDFMVEETQWLSGDVKDKVKYAVKKYANMAGERNGYIHYPFGYDTANEDDEFAIYKAKRSRTGDQLLQKRPVTPDMIQEFADKVSVLYDELCQAHRSLYDARYQALQAQPPYPGLSSATLPLRSAPIPRAMQKPQDQ
jgi:hypothetical protein